MPKAIPRPCRAGNCSGVTTNRNGYCEAHQAKASGWLKQDRGSSSQRGYGGRWKRIRTRIMRRDKALCQPCKEEGKVMPAVGVVPIQAGLHVGFQGFQFGFSISHDGLRLLSDSIGN